MDRESVRYTANLTGRDLITANVPAFIAAAFLAASLVLLFSPHRAQTASCFMGEAASPDGLAAPTDLTVSLVATQGGYAVDLTWTDNASDETCFVVERAFGAAVPRDYQVIATLGANSTSYHDPGPFYYPTHTVAFYRVYAATETTRSEYSNEDGTTFPVAQPTASPTPSASPTGSPAPTLQSPAPSATAIVSPSPARLPQSGGGSKDGTALWVSLIALTLAAAAIAAVIFVLTRLRRSP